jgi:phosphoribosylanthranilate isomerase
VADARLAEAAGADAIGLVLTPGRPRSLRLDDAAEIAAAVTLEMVAVLADPDPARLREVYLSVAPGRFQFEGEPPAVPPPLPWYRTLPFRGRGDLAALASVPGDRVLLRVDPAILPGGRLWGRDRTLLQEMGRAAAVVVGAPASGLEAVLREVRPAGVDLREAVEREPGVIDPDRLRMAMRTIRGR